MKLTFPKWKADPNETIRKLAKNFDETALDLLLQMIHLEPGRRISARSALKHPFFADMH